MVEFETMRMSDAQIEIRDAATGHVFVFTVVETSDGARMLSAYGLVTENQAARLTAKKIGERARNYAEA